jgi:hypothetical protein
MEAFIDGVVDADPIDGGLHRSDHTLASTGSPATMPGYPSPLRSMRPSINLGMRWLALMERLIDRKSVASWLHAER